MGLLVYWDYVVVDDIKELCMNYYQAVNILDEVREGANYPVYIINKALELTGDLDGSGIFEGQRSTRMGEALQKESERSGLV